MGFCANCGRQRDGEARFCAGCGTEFTGSPAHREQTVLVDHSAADSAALPDDARPAADDTPATRLDLNAGGTDGQPDPFASWYQPEQAAPAAGNPGGADGFWPTQTVGTAPSRASGYPPPPAYAQLAPGCHWGHRKVWVEGYGYQWQTVQVCP